MVARRQRWQRLSRALLVAVVMVGASVTACSNSMGQANADSGGGGPPAWSAAGVPGAFPPRMSHVGLAFQDRIWIMGGEGADGTERNDVWSSADGVTWTMATNAAAWSARGLGAGVVFQNKMWLIDGARQSDVWTSTDGATWTSVSQSPSFPPRYGHCALVFNDRIWILGGYGAAGTQINDVLSSADGAAWTRVTAAAAWSPRDNFGCVVSGGKMWVIDGVRQGDVWSSTDGATWTAVTPTTPFTPTQAFQSVAWRGEIWTLGGNGASGQDINSVFHSPDGVAWTPMTEVPWNPRAFFSAVVFADKVWVLDGDVRLGDAWKMQ
jgi:hypothetical protein